MIFTQARDVDGELMRLDAGLEYELPKSYAQEFLDIGVAHETDPEIKTPSERKPRNGRTKTRNRTGI